MTEGQAVLRIDPSQPAGERATIISGGDLESDALKDFLKEIEDPDNTMEKQAEEFWCDSNDDENAFSDFDLSSFTIISEDDSQAVLRPDATLLAEILMQSDSDDQMDKGERKMMEKLLKRIEGEVTLAKPNAEMLGFEVRMTRPMKMMLVAKLKEMTVKQDCEMAPNGYYHMSSFQMNVSGKALGSRFGQALNVQVSDLRPLQ